MGGSLLWDQMRKVNYLLIQIIYSVNKRQNKISPYGTFLNPRYRPFLNICNWRLQVNNVRDH
jgi:hypothetical protein